MNKSISEIVYNTSISEIEKLNTLNIEQIEEHPYLLKVSQIKNNHILAIIKQEEIDYKEKDLSLRLTMYGLRDDRNKVMKEHIKLQEHKLNETKNMD
jgi:hypothetical protein